MKYKNKSVNEIKKTKIKKKKKKKRTEQTREVYILCSRWRCDSIKIFFVAIQEKSLLKKIKLIKK